MKTKIRYSYSAFCTVGNEMYGNQIKIRKSNEIYENQMILAFKHSTLEDASLAQGGWAGIQTDRRRNTHRDRQRNTQTHKQTDIQTDKHTDWQVNRKTDR